jgi:three-Cys-motif partner protein
VTNREDFFDAFGPHTLLKHGVLDRYVKAWIQILKQHHEKLWIVDGFAGRGQDGTGQPGSPLLLARTAAAMRGEGAEIYLIAIEERRDHFEALVQALAAFDAEREGTTPVAYLRRGTLAQLTDDAFKLIKRSPAFVFLDPFGADGLSLEFVRRTLALPKGEVFALFSTRAIFRHLAVLAADRHIDRVHNAAAQPQLFPDLDQTWLATQLDRASRSDASLLPTKQAAERILDDLFGGSAQVDRILALPSASWPTEVLGAYLERLKDCKASHVTQLAVFDEEQQQAYYLLHAAKNRVATLKMKEAVNTALSKSSLPERSKAHIRFSHPVRVDQVVDLVRQQFAGQDVRWTDEARGAATVQGYALGETPMMADQAAALKAALTSVYLLDRKPLRFRLPPMNGERA